MMAHLPLRGMVKNRVLDMFAGMYRAGGAPLDLHAADAPAGAGAVALLERLAARYVQWRQQR
jgi:hypothetical protein